MYYMGTVLFSMNESEFWRCTPRKLFALLQVHNKRFEGEIDQQQTQRGFIDQVL